MGTLIKAVTAVVALLMLHCSAQTNTTDGNKQLGYLLSNSFQPSSQLGACTGAVYSVATLLGNCTTGPEACSGKFVNCKSSIKLVNTSMECITNTFDVTYKEFSTPNCAHGSSIKGSTTISIYPTKCVSSKSYSFVPYSQFTQNSFPLSGLPGFIQKQYRIDNSTYPQNNGTCSTVATTITYNSMDYCFGPYTTYTGNFSSSVHFTYYACFQGYTYTVVLYDTATCPSMPTNIPSPNYLTTQDYGTKCWLTNNQLTGQTFFLDTICVGATYTPSLTPSFVPSNSPTSLKPSGAPTKVPEYPMGYVITSTFQSSTSGTNECIGAENAEGKLIGKCVIGECSGQNPNCVATVKYVNQQTVTSSGFEMIQMKFSSPNCASNSKLPLTSNLTTIHQSSSCIYNAKITYIELFEFKATSAFNYKNAGGIVQILNSGSNCTEDAATAISYSTNDFCFGPYENGNTVSTLPSATLIYISYPECTTGSNYTVNIYTGPGCDSFPYSTETYSGNPCSPTISYAATGSYFAYATTICISPVPSVSPTAYPSTEPSAEPTLCPSVIPSSIPTMSPTTTPSLSPTGFPTKYPTVEPSREPSTDPSVYPSHFPSMCPSLAPSSLPSILPSLEPSVFPSITPSVSPSLHPSKEPSLFPSLIPSLEPTFIPSRFPTIIPTSPTTSPTFTPIGDPTVSPSLPPSVKPSFPTINPTTQPTVFPTSAFPSVIPSYAPTSVPSLMPTNLPTIVPSNEPSHQPSTGPTGSPSVSPSVTPSQYPTFEPTISPSYIPSVVPSIIPTLSPSVRPSAIPSIVPSSKPSKTPSHSPSYRPSVFPSLFPSQTPTITPTTFHPTQFPSIIPSLAPSTVIPSTSTPTIIPSFEPSTKPTIEPSTAPSVSPTFEPSCCPSNEPSIGPSVIPSTLFPTSFPSMEPTTIVPSSAPSFLPSVIPSEQPSVVPSFEPSGLPTFEPSESPSIDPSEIPSSKPSIVPSYQPSVLPSSKPSKKPSVQPSLKPSIPPSFVPTRAPSLNPSNMPSAAPSIAPTFSPTAEPSQDPTQLPSTTPSSAPSSLPSLFPSFTLTSTPTTKPSQVPSLRPSREPSQPPSRKPSFLPSVAPTCIPSVIPSSIPTAVPTITPSLSPSKYPSKRPSLLPSTKPSTEPSGVPSKNPSSPPTSIPSVEPSIIPTTKPNVAPSWSPSPFPSAVPTVKSTSSPSSPPSTAPNATPSTKPTVAPLLGSSSFPRSIPSVISTTSPYMFPSTDPSTIPTTKPTAGSLSSPICASSTFPSIAPTCSLAPTRLSFPSTTTLKPTAYPSVPLLIPTQSPSLKPIALVSNAPSKSPTVLPSVNPTFAPEASPSLAPTNFPSCAPSKSPTSFPSVSSSLVPIALPSSLPICTPSGCPTAIPNTITPTCPIIGTIKPFSAPSYDQSLCPTVARHPFSSLAPAVPTTSSTPVPTISLVIPTFSPTDVPNTNPSTTSIKSTSIPSIYSLPNQNNLTYTSSTKFPSTAPILPIYHLPSAFPSITSSATIIPADIPLPLLISSTIGSLFASSSACSGSGCIGSLGQFTPSSSLYIEAPASTHHYLNASTFSSIYYDFGPSAATPSITVSLGGLTVASMSGTFSTSPCSALAFILKTPTIHVDDSTIAAVYYATDSKGRLQCSYTSIKMTINNGTTVLSTGSCSQSTNPTGKCTYFGSNSHLFNGDTLMAVITMTTTASQLTASGSVLFSAARTNPSTYDNLRGYVMLPQGNVFPGDRITATIIIYSASTATSIGSCSVVVYFNSSLLEYVSNSVSSVLYSPVADSGVDYVHIVFGPKTATDVTGVGLVSIGSIQFSVRSAISESTTSLFSGQLQSLGGVHGTSFCESKYSEQSCSSQNANYGTYFTGTTADLLYLDMVGAPGHTPGKVMIVIPSVVGLYATSSFSTMVNTAPMNGVYPSDVMTVYATYGTSRSSWADFPVPASKLSCAPISNQSKAGLMVSPNIGGNGCKIQATSGGSSEYFVQASYAGSVVVGSYRVYYPLNFTVIATRRTLRRLSSCPMFESSVVKVLTTLHLDSTNFVSDVDVTSILSLDTSDHAVATYTSASNSLTGKGLRGSSGMFKLITIGRSSGITLINSDFTVSTQTAMIIGMYTFAYSSVQVTLSTLSLAEIAPLQVSVSILRPDLNGQTTFRSTVPLSNYAYLVTYALADDGYFTDVSQYAGLSLLSLDSSNVNVSSTGSGSNFFWFAYVPQNAVGTSGNLLRPELRDNCNNILSHSSVTHGYVFSTSGTPSRATLTVTNNRLSKRGGCATISPINIPHYTQLTAKLYLNYPTATIDMTSDSRTQYSFETTTAGVNLTVSNTGNIQVQSPSESGNATITVTFPGYRGASAIKASVIVHIVDLVQDIRIGTVDYPGGTVSPFKSLKQIGCSGVYQRASLSAVAILTDDSAVDVTSATTFSLSSPFKLFTSNGTPYGTGPGKAIVAVSTPHATELITANFCSSTGNFTIESGGTASVSSLRGLQYGSQSVQKPIGQGCATSVYTVSTSASIGCGATTTQGCKPSSLQIHFSDGTFLQYSDLANIGLYPGKLLIFNSTDDKSIGVNSSTGALTAVKNSYQYASINVNSVCYSNLTTLPVYTSVANVAANLYPIDNDVKFGYTTGLSYVQCPNSKVVSIPGYFKVPSGFYLEAWDVTFYYRGKDLIYSNTLYDSSGGSWSTLDPPTVSTLSTDSSISYVHLFSNAYTTLSTSTEGNGQLVHIADLSFRTSSTSIISVLTAIVAGLYYNPISSTSLDSKVSQATSTTSFYCTSCAGFIKLNNGEAFDSFMLMRHHRELLVPDRTFIIPSSYNQVVNGDVDGNGLCGSEDYIESLTLYALPMYWKTQQLTVIEARSAGLSLNYLSHCTNQYCGNGNYTVPFLMSNLVLVDSAASLNSYARLFPIMQFLQTQTPCDIVTQLPTNFNPVMNIQLLLYSPKVDNSGFTGVPITCGSNTNVYFEINFPHNQIADLIDGGVFQSNNTATTVVGPAACLGNGAFATTIKVFSVLPSCGYYAVGVGINSTFGNSHTQAAYYNIQFPRLYGGATKFDPLYNSNNCPAAPIDVPTVLPSRSSTVKTISPSSKSVVSSSTAPPVLNPTHIVTPTTAPRVIPAISPWTIPPTYSTSSPSKTTSTSPSISESAPTHVTFSPFKMASLVPSLLSTKPLSLNEESLRPVVTFLFNHTSSPITKLNKTASPLTALPTAVPSANTSIFPTMQIQLLVPSTFPTANPYLSTSLPMPMPSDTSRPFLSPSWEPVLLVPNLPSALSTTPPSGIPSACRTVSPTTSFSLIISPSALPTISPHVSPSTFPANCPSIPPTIVPRASQSVPPSDTPSIIPPNLLSAFPTALPPVSPSAFPGDCPSIPPTILPSVSSTVPPSDVPSVTPIILQPAFPTVSPSTIPTHCPSAPPAMLPSIAPTMLPTYLPSISPSLTRSNNPSTFPSLKSRMPTFVSTSFPTDQPKTAPTLSPTTFPTDQPKTAPTLSPTTFPTDQPKTAPTLSPTTFPTDQPKTAPTLSPTTSPPTFSPHAQVTTFDMCGITYKVDNSLIGVTGKYTVTINFLNATIAQFAQSATSTAFASTIECILPANNLLSIPTIDLTPTQSTTNALTIVVQYVITFTVPSFITVTAPAVTDVVASIPNGIDPNIYAYYNASSHDFLMAISSGNFSSMLHSICIQYNCSIKNAIPIKTSGSVGAVTVVQRKSVNNANGNSTNAMTLAIAVPIAVVCGLAIIFTMIMLFNRRDTCTRSASVDLQEKESIPSIASDLTGPKVLRSNPLRDSYVERNTLVDRSQDENFVKTQSEGFSFDRLYPSRYGKKPSDLRPSLDGRGSLIGFGSKPTDFRPSFV